MDHIPMGTERFCLGKVLAYVQDRNEFCLYWLGLHLFMGSICKWIFNCIYNANRECNEQIKILSHICNLRWLVTVSRGYTLTCQ